jgi:hypothetical protein
MNKHKDLRNSSLDDNDYNDNYQGLEKFIILNSTNDKEIKKNNYLSKSLLGKTKGLDNIYKLEKEAQILKEEIKNNLIIKNSKETNYYDNSNLSPIYNEYNLWNMENQVKQNTKLENSIVNNLFEKLKNSNLFKISKNNNSINNSSFEKSNSFNKIAIIAENTKEIRSLSKKNSIDENKNINNLRNNYNSNKNNINNINDINNINNNLNTRKLSFSGIEDNNDQIDKMHETPGFNKLKKYEINNNIEKDNLSSNKLKTSPNINSNKNENDKKLEIAKLQNELDKIKNQNNNKDNGKNQINIISNYNLENQNQKMPLSSEREKEIESSINEISIGNITSSNEWELDTHRKNKKGNKDLNTNVIGNSSNDRINTNATINKNKQNKLNQNNNQIKSGKLKDIKEKINSNAFENSLKINYSIKEESDEQEKENISSFDNYNDNSDKKDKKKEKITSSNDKEIFNKENSNKNKLNSVTGSNNKNADKSISQIYNLTNKSNNSYQDFENTENLEGLNMKNSFNKFSNVNFEYDNNKDLDYEIKSENPSENYGDDFIYDDIENKQGRISVDLDAIKSHNFTSNSHIGKDINQKNNNSFISRKKNNNIPNYNNSISNENKIDRFLQTKNSFGDEGIEGKLYF